MSHVWWRRGHDKPGEGTERNCAVFFPRHAMMGTASYNVVGNHIKLIKTVNYLLVDAKGATREL